jgi:prolyl oligopeptidase
MLLDDYIDGSEDWELVLDLDKLAEGEDEDWVWKGAQCLRPEYRRCLLNLSRGGADAVVVREFDVETKTFVMLSGHHCPGRNTASLFDCCEE